MIKIKSINVFSKIRRCLVIFVLAFLMLLFGWIWLFFGNMQKTKIIPSVQMPRRKWTNEERAEWKSTLCKYDYHVDI